MKDLHDLVHGQRVLGVVLRQCALRECLGILGHQGHLGEIENASDRLVGAATGGLMDEERDGRILQVSDPVGSAVDLELANHLRALRSLAGKLKRFYPI